MPGPASGCWGLGHRWLRRVSWFKLKTGCAEAGEVGGEPKAPHIAPLLPSPLALHEATVAARGLRRPHFRARPRCPDCHCPVKRRLSNLRFVPLGLVPCRPPPQLRSPPSSTLRSRRPSWRDEPMQTSGSVQTPPAFTGLAGTGRRPPLPSSLPTAPSSDPLCCNNLGSRTELPSASGNSGGCWGHPLPRGGEFSKNGPTSRYLAGGFRESLESQVKVLHRRWASKKFKKFALQSSGTWKNCPESRKGFVGFLAAFFPLTG